MTAPALTLLILGIAAVLIIEAVWRWFERRVERQHQAAEQRFRSIMRDRYGDR